MRLSDDSSAIREARNYASAWSRANALPSDVADDVALIVSELVTNAVRHGSPPYDVELSRRPAGVRGELRDASTVLPFVRPNPDESGGYGLVIVSARARWGAACDDAGKHVWFEIH
jgi:two-component sensor histidine kinase